MADPRAKSAVAQRTRILAIKNIVKNYPGVQALKDVSLDLRKGEVHAIVGENGAGKSTLIKILTGAEKPDRGTIVIDGTSYKELTPAAALGEGIAAIYQEFTLVSSLSASDNVFLGNFYQKGPVLDRKRMKRHAAKLFARLGVNIDPSTSVERLTTGYQQIVEIAKAIARNARILIMDEPSAPLTASEVDAMYQIVDSLRSEGITVIYISHRLDEVYRLADRVTVLRDGERVATRETNETTRSELIKLMVGRELTTEYPRARRASKNTALRVVNLSGNGVKNISFEARRGEIVGFGGLIGAGRTELMELIFGVASPDSGTVILDGKPINARTPRQAIKNNFGFVPEDRKRHGLVLDFDIHDNINLTVLKRSSRYGIPHRESLTQNTATYFQDLQIKASSAQQVASTLSGGNQQKVVLGKWLATQPDVLIFDEPTRGIDIGARMEIYEIMDRLALQGRIILMVSSDMEELIGMSDRVVVLREGRQQGILDRHEVSQESILTLAAEGSGLN